MFIENLTGKTYEFAAACYDMNSVEELSQPHTPDDSDPMDCNEWGLTAKQWAQAVDAALMDKLMENAL